MEFVSEEEAIEYFGHPVSLEDNGYSFNCDVAEGIFIETKKEERKEFFVGALVSGSILYVTKKGVSYDKTQAKVFSESDAKNKAIFMKKNGRYSWKAIRKN